jgi:hypothetical protein
MSWRCGCLSIARKTRFAGIHDRCQVRYERLLVLMSILPSDCGAARAFLDIGSRQIGARAIVSSDTIADSEIGDRTPLPNSLAAISAALDAAGGIVINEAARGKASGIRRSGTGPIVRRATGQGKGDPSAECVFNSTGMDALAGTRARQG